MGRMRATRISIKVKSEAMMSQSSFDYRRHFTAQRRRAVVLLKSAYPTRSTDCLSSAMTPLLDQDNHS
jgi:hypothetical protein